MQLGFPDGTEWKSKQENNRKPILKFFIDKQAHILPLPYKENFLTHSFHLPRSYPFPTTCLAAPKGICNIFSPKHNSV